MTTSTYRIAVLLTCFNRRDDTLSCLESLKAQDQGENVLNIDTIMVDDGSTDGTADSVRERYPETHILEGDGQLFWNGGMRLAFDEALKCDYDFYLWLNDDTVLLPDSLRRLVSTYQALSIEGYPSSIVVGSTCDPDTGRTTYGGVNSLHTWWPLKYKLQEPADVPTQCDTMNGNCVLIPRAVTQKVKGLDATFTHYLGDHDYGLRTRQAGGHVWIAPGYYGVCEKSKPLRKRETGQGMKQDIATLDTPKGLSIGDTDLTSFREWKHYCKRHGGSLLWPIYWLAPYRRLLLQRLPGYSR